MGGRPPTPPGSRPSCWSAPSTPPERARRALRARREGFLYAVARMGVTGERDDARPARVGPVVAGCGPHVDLPGLRRHRDLAPPTRRPGSCEVADGVVVGSALVRRLLDGRRTRGGGGVRGASCGRRDSGREPPGVSLAGTEHQAAVVAAEPEGVREHRPGVERAGLAGHDVEVDLGVELLEAGGRGDHAVDDGERPRPPPRSPRPPPRLWPGEALDRGDRGPGLAEDLVDGPGLGQVVERRRGAVRVDVADVGGGEPGVLQGELHAGDGPGALGVGGRDVVGVGRAGRRRAISA